MACAFHSDPVNSDLLTLYIQIAEDFIGRCEKIKIPGAQKLKKRCQAELKFLQSLKHKKSRVSNHLSSSNLGHFASLIHAVETLPAVTKILHPFSQPGRDSLPVDVIACQGHLWVKVIARKAQALHLVWAGRGQFGEKTLLDQAAEYLSLASCHQVNFRDPKLCYVFYSGVTIAMATALKDIGVLVCGETVDVSEEVIAKLSSVYDLDLDSDKGSDFDIDSASDQDSVISDEQEAFRSVDNGMIENDACKTIEKSLNNMDLQNEEVSSSNSAYSDNSVQAARNSIEHVDERVHRDTKITKSLIYFPRYYFFDGEALSSEMKQLFHQDASSTLCSELPQTEGADSLLDSSPLMKVNLDITALIALISAITHGRCNFVFEEPVLTDQAEEERRCPVLPKMKEFLKGKELFACQTAVTAFNTILETLGGRDEKQRAVELMRDVKVVADQPSLRTQRLPTSSKIKERSKVIFGTGDELKMITLTANSGFVRAAKNQGVSFTVHLHSARALTQEKERSAKVINLETGETVT